MLFSNMDSNCAHFANFNVAHFEIEESFGLIWVKVQNGWFRLQYCISSKFRYALNLRKSQLLLRKDPNDSFNEVTWNI